MVHHDVGESHGAGSRYDRKSPCDETELARQREDRNLPLNSSGQDIPGAKEPFQDTAGVGIDCRDVTAHPSKGRVLLETCSVQELQDSLIQIALRESLVVNCSLPFHLRMQIQVLLRPRRQAWQLRLPFGPPLEHGPRDWLPRLFEAHYCLRRMDLDQLVS